MIAVKDIFVQISNLKHWRRTIVRYYARCLFISNKTVTWFQISVTFIFGEFIMIGRWMTNGMENGTGQKQSSEPMMTLVNTYTI